MSTINDDQLVERLVPKVLASIRSKAKPVETIPVKDSLEGITSLPAYDTTGGQHKQVLVSLESLKEPALSAGQEAQHATQQASQATERANTATTLANEASERANKSANEADLAAEAANEFAGKIVVCSEDEYDALKEAGDLDDNKLYFVHEEE